MLVMSDRGLVLCGEWLERNRPMAEHAQGLRRMLGSFNPGAPFTPAHWAVDRSQRQAQIELAQHGVYTTPAENDVVAGIERVKSWMHSGQFWILERFAPRTVEQLASYQWAENYDKRGEAKREKVKKINDDLADPVRYAVMTWPSLPTADEVSSGRDLRNVPEEHRWAIERMQRIDAAERARARGTPTMSEFFDAGYTATEDTPVGPGGSLEGFWG